MGIGKLVDCMKMKLVSRVLAVTILAASTVGVSGCEVFMGHDYSKNEVIENIGYLKNGHSIDKVTDSRYEGEVLIQMDVACLLYYSGSGKGGLDHSLASLDHNCPGNNCCVEYNIHDANRDGVICFSDGDSYTVQTGVENHYYLGQSADKYPGENWVVKTYSSEALHKIVNEYVIVDCSGDYELKLEKMVPSGNIYPAHLSAMEDDANLLMEAIKGIDYQ